MEFKDVVINFARLDAESKALSKQATPLKERIKKHMAETGIGEFSEGPVKAKFTVQERTSMNEDRLVQVLHDLGFQEAIKTVEKPDQNVIEDLIYEGKLDPTQLAECVETKRVEVLKVTGGDKL